MTPNRFVRPMSPEVLCRIFDDEQVAQPGRQPTQTLPAWSLWLAAALASPFAAAFLSWAGQ